MSLEDNINLNTGQMLSGTIGGITPQISSCCTNKESNSINYYNSKKSASNFKKVLIDNISAQKKNIENKEKTTTTRDFIAEAAPAAATSEYLRRKIATGGTVGHHSMHPAGQKARLLPPPPQRTPPTWKPSILKIQPRPTPPSRPPQRQEKKTIAVKATQQHGGENTSRNKEGTAHHTTIILQRTYKKGKGMQWQQKTPQQTPNRKNHSSPKRKKLKDLMNDIHTKITPYANHYSETDDFAPLFLASRVVNTPGRYGYVYFSCKACKKEIVNRNNFISHHRTLYHLQNMEEWIKKLIHDNYKDQIQYKTRKVSIELVKEAQKAIAEHLQKLNQLRAKVQAKNNQQTKNTYPSQEKEITKMNQDVHHDDTRIIKTPKQIHDVDLATYSKARQAILQECPPQLTAFKSKILKLLSNMYADRRTNDLRLQFSIKFYETRKPHRHWIIEMFETIKRRPNAWKFIKDNVNQNNLSFAGKKEAQKQELRRISGMARTLFRILLNCHFVPLSYLILLAVLMSTENITKNEGTSVCLKNGMIIDLALEEGAIIFQALKQKTGVIRLEEETLQYKRDLIEDWRDDNHVFTSKISPTILLSSVAEVSEDENYQALTQLCPFSTIRQNMSKAEEFYNINNIEFEIFTHLNDETIIENRIYEEQEPEATQHPYMSKKLILQEFESLKQNTTEEIATQEVMFDPETEHTNIDLSQSRHKTDMWPGLDTQCSKLLPITPRIIAQKLFQHWGEQLNFNEDVHQTNNDTFIIETVNELTNLAQRATPYQPYHRRQEVKCTSNGASRKNLQ